MKRFILFIFLLPICLLAEIEQRIGVVVLPAFGGELEFVQKMKIACNHLNWKLDIYQPDTFCERQCRDDWIFTMVPTRNIAKKMDNYLVLFCPERCFFHKTGQLKKQFLDFSGYLTTYDDTELLMQDLKHSDHLLYPKRWYPTAQFREYQTVTPTRLFFIIGHWGNRLTDQRYQTLQNLLADTSYAKLYGNPDLGKKYGTAFQGNLPFDGTSVIETISEMGVCLALHSKEHLKHGIPSGRIFEAAAASSVIISDLNPFVIEHFGDSVLYIDHTLSGEEMFRQVDQHMEWIRENPEEALEMAQRSYQIFISNFLLEQQLLDFAEWRQGRI